MKLISIIVYTILNYIYINNSFLYTYDKSESHEIDNFMNYNDSHFLAFSNNERSIFFMNIINGSLSDKNSSNFFDIKYIKETNTYYRICSYNYLLFLNTNENIKNNISENIKNCDFYFIKNNSFLLSIIFPNQIQLYNINFCNNIRYNNLILNYDFLIDDNKNYLNFFSYKLHDNFITIFNNKTLMKIITIKFSYSNKKKECGKLINLQLFETQYPKFENYFPFGVLQFNNLIYSLIYGINKDSNELYNIFLLKINNENNNNNLENNIFTLVSNISVEYNDIYSKSISVKKFNESLLIYSFYRTNNNIEICFYNIIQNISFNCFSDDNLLNEKKNVNIDILIISSNSIGLYLYLNDNYKYISIIFENCFNYELDGYYLDNVNIKIINNLSNCKNCFIYFFNNNKPIFYDSNNDTIIINNASVGTYNFLLFNQIDNNNFYNIYNNSYIKSCNLILKCFKIKDDNNKDICYSKCPNDYSLKCDGDGEFECYDNNNTNEYYYDNNELCLKPCVKNCLKCNEENCTECKENFALKTEENKKCYNISENLDYYYYNKIKNIFDKCNITCKTCDNSYSCINCNYTIYEGNENECYTLNCKLGYASKKDFSDNYCYSATSLMDYYFYDIISKFFEKCFITCKTCNNPKNCTKCDDNSSFINYEDYLNYYQNKEYECFDEFCSDNYASLENDYNYFCYQKEQNIIGFYYDESEHEFKKCIDNCLKCKNNYSCSKCKYNYGYIEKDDGNECKSIKVEIDDYFYNYCTENFESKNKKLSGFIFKCKNYELFFYSYLFWINLCFIFSQLILFELFNNESLGLSLLFNNLFNNEIRDNINYCNEISESKKIIPKQIVIIHNQKYINDNNNTNNNEINNNNIINNEINNNNIIHNEIKNEKLIDDEQNQNNKLIIKRNNNNINNMYNESTINNEINLNNNINNINDIDNTNNEIINIENKMDKKKLSKQNTALFQNEEVHNKITNQEERKEPKRKKYSLESINSINNSDSDGSDGSDGFGNQQTKPIKEVEIDKEPDFEIEPYYDEGKIKHFKSKFIFFLKNNFIFIRLIKNENFQFMLLKISLFVFFITLLFFFNMLFYIKHYSKKIIKKKYNIFYFMPKWLLCSFCSLVIYHLLILLLYKKDINSEENEKEIIKRFYKKNFQFQKKYINLYFIIILLFSFFHLYYSITFGLFYKNYQYFVIIDVVLSLIISSFLLFIIILFITIIIYILD